MYNKNKKRSISRIILVGLVLQLLPQQTACASIAIPLALPAIAHYVSGFAAIGVYAKYATKTAVPVSAETFKSILRFVIENRC